MSRSIKTRIKDRLQLYNRKYIMKGFYSATPDTPKAVVKALKMSAINGDYYEFGLFKGYAFYKAVSADPSIMHFGFDSFEGLPETDEGGKFKKGNYLGSKEEVEFNLKKRGCLNDKVRLIKGFYKDSLTESLQEELINNKAKVVLVDVDLYESTVPVLNFVKPMLQKRTIILFDDWNCFDANPQKGERKAFSEFLDKNTNIKVKEIFSFGWHGQAFEVTDI